MPHMNMMLRALFLLCALAAVAVAQPKKKYHFDLAAVNVKPEVKPDVAKSAQPRIEEQVKKTFGSHPQLVGKLDGAPDWKTQAEAYRKYLAAKGLAGAFHVTVDITDASEELVPTDKPNTQRYNVRIAIHMLGETMPGRTMGFTGDGQATIKQEVGKKLTDRDKKYTWDSAAEEAVKDAMAKVFKQLAVPQKKQ
jgi:hypothetical protein